MMIAKVVLITRNKENKKIYFVKFFTYLEKSIKCEYKDTELCYLNRNFLYLYLQTQDIY